MPIQLSETQPVRSRYNLISYILLRHGSFTPMRTPKDIAVVPSNGAPREPLVRRRRRISAPLPLRVEWLAAESFPLTEEAVDAVERLLGPELEKLLAQSERDEKPTDPADQAP